MKPRFSLLVLLLLVLTCFILKSDVLALYGTPTLIGSSGSIHYNAGPVNGWLHTDGIWVKDGAGLKVAMRGIHIGVYYVGSREVVTQSLIDVAKAHGATYIELGWNLRVGTDGYLDFEKLDRAIDLCEANNIYVVLDYLAASSDLIRNGLATSWQDVIPTDAWKQIIQRYADRPVVVGVKLIDEPNFSGDSERQMWTNAIETLRPYNPNLLWFTHVINWVRFTYTGDDLVWRTIEDVPDNVLVDGGGWVRTSAGDPTLELDDYAYADTYMDDLVSSLLAYRNDVPMPVGMAYGSSHVTEENAHTYYLRESGRKLEAEHLYRTYYISEYIWLSYDAEGVCDRILPDAPYSDYW